jgi:hypothetical protein
VLGRAPTHAADTNAKTPVSGGHVRLRSLNEDRPERKASTALDCPESPFENAYIALDTGPPKF